MIIDLPRPEQLPGLKALWQQAFEDSPAFVERFFGTGFSQDRCRCLTVEGALAAALYWFDCQWQGQRLAYLYAVATDQAFQNRGLCRALMEDTHRHLKVLGYAGCVLVPAEPELFSMYEKMGYQGFCPMTTHRIPADAPIAVRSLDDTDYARKRRMLLPENSVVQEGAALAYLNTYGAFYEADGCVFACGREQDVLYMQEFLGDPDKLPGIIAGLGALEALVRLPGGSTPLAMYRSLTDNTAMPQYFGIPLD